MAQHIRRTSIALAMTTAIVVAGCSKKNDAATDTQRTAAGAVADSTANRTLTVADVSLGRHVGADKKVADATTDFARKDSIFASVHTTGNRPAKLTARWTFQDGQVVDEHSEDISPTGDAYTEFHIVKPSGWPAGKYTLHVLLDGNETQTKDFTVK
jgi:hypothetical protein